MGYVAYHHGSQMWRTEVPAVMLDRTPAGCSPMGQVLALSRDRSSEGSEESGNWHHQTHSIGPAS